MKHFWVDSDPEALEKPWINPGQVLDISWTIARETLDNTPIHGGVKKNNFKSSPPSFGPLEPLDPFAKSFRFLKLHLTWSRVHHPTPFNRSHHWLGSETI